MSIQSRIERAADAVEHGAVVNPKTMAMLMRLMAQDVDRLPLKTATAFLTIVETVLSSEAS